MEKRSRLRRRSLNNVQAKNYTSSPLSNAYPPPIGKSPYHEITYFGIEHKYGVIKLATFSHSRFAPPSSSYTFPQDVYDTLSLALKYFRSHDYDKIIIDLSNNPGGDTSAGYAALQAFFPSARPYYGRDLRLSPLLQASSHATSNNSGSTGSIFEEPPLERITDYHLYTNAEGHNYSSVAKFLDPVRKIGDSFTNLSRLNDSAQLDQSMINRGELLKANISFSGAAPFAAENVMLLSDSLCGSTCAVFAEAMREAGVRSVAYGGPASAKGKMQVTGGTRGYVSRSCLSSEFRLLFSQLHRPETPKTQNGR